jgi:hypothetical protein
MNQPAVRFFGEGRSVLLLEPLVVKFRETGDSLVVPAGSISDFASIPGKLQSMVNKLGPYNLPAVVHDYLYSTQLCTRRQTDDIFFRMLRDVGTSGRTHRFIFIAVRNFGGGYWEKSARLRAEGVIEVAPEGAREPGTYETHAQYQSYLQTLGVPEQPEPVITPGFCTCIPTSPYRKIRAR